MAHIKKEPEAVELFAMHAQKVLRIQILTFSQQSGMYCVTLVVWSSFQSHPAAVMLQSVAEEVYLLKTKNDFVLSTLFKLLWQKGISPSNVNVYNVTGKVVRKITSTCLIYSDLHWNSYELDVKWLQRTCVEVYIYNMGVKIIKLGFLWGGLTIFIDQT